MKRLNVKVSLEPLIFLAIFFFTNPGINICFYLYKGLHQFRLAVDYVLWLHPTLAGKHECQCLKCQVLATRLKNMAIMRQKGHFGCRA